MGEKNAIRLRVTSHSGVEKDFDLFQAEASADAS